MSRGYNADVMEWLSRDCDCGGVVVVVGVYLLEVGTLSWGAVRLLLGVVFGVLLDWLVPSLLLTRSW